MVLPLIIAAGVAGAGLLKAHGSLDRNRTFDNAFDPEKQTERLAQYRDALGLGDDFTYSAGAFDKYLQDRQDSIEDLNTIFKDPKTQEALKSPAFREPLMEALRDKEGSLATAAKEYEENAKVFGELVKQIPQKFKTGQVIKAMKEIIDDGVDKIKAQQAKERESLKQQLDDENFKDTLTSEMNKQGVLNITKAKEGMLKELDAAHAAQLKAFQDSTAASLRQLHDSARKEMDRVIYLSTISDYNQKTRAAIGRAAEERRKTMKAPPLMAVTGVDPKNPDVGVVQIKDLDTIYTRTGKFFTQDANGKLSLNMGSQLGNPSYFFLGNQPESDMEAMARHIKAQGSKSIKMEVDMKDPERAKRMAQQAYEACINGGFPPEKIRIMVNGEEWKLDKIFDQGSSMPAHLKARAQEIQNEEASITEVKPEGDTNAIKEELKTLRAQAQAAEAARIEEETRRAEQEAMAAEDRNVGEPTTPGPT